MSEQPAAPTPIAPVEEIQREWFTLASRVSQLETQRAALELENKALRRLLETAIEHRHKSHAELVIILTNVVSKLPINEVGVLVSRLVEHNTHVSQFLTALAKGATEIELPQPTVLKSLEQAKRELVTAVKPLVEELIQLETPVEADLLRALPTEPELFFSPRMTRASRCFLKGQVARERIVREFGEAALVCFNDMTTDSKLNPRPKRDEILLAFKNDFDSSPELPTAVLPEKRQDLRALFQKVQRSKGNTESARAQRNAFLRLSFLIDLLHYYLHQSTEPVDAVFAQRLPGLVEQLAATGPQDALEEKLLVQIEELLAHVISTDHRLMVINNVGKGGGAAKTLKFVLRLRAPRISEDDEHMVVVECARHLLPTTKAPPPETIATLLRLVPEAQQRLVVRALMVCDRIRREEAEALGRAIAAILGIKELAEAVKRAAPAVPPDVERRQAWEKIKELIKRRRPATAIAAAIRDRLHARYDADEVRQSWLTLIEADAISQIRIFCQIPYRADGKTDEIAQTILETYVSRLTHEKYAAVYHKIVTSLKNMYHAKHDSPTLVNFVALVRWASPEAAGKIAHDVGMPLPAH